MTRLLDDTKPDGSEVGADLATYLREARIAINQLADLVGPSAPTRITEVTIEPGADYFNLDSAAPIQVVFVGSNDPVPLRRVKMGIDGQVLLMRVAATSAAITATHNTNYMRLTNSDDVALAANDWLMLVNVGGDGNLNEGYWVESNRYVWTP